LNFEGGQRQFFWKKDDNLDFYENERQSQKNNAIKSKNNGCGTAPGNLVWAIDPTSQW
jgi:hypothetical protein